MGMSAEDQIAGRLPGGDDTQPAGQQQAAATATPAKKWAGKYDSPDEMEKAHKELESKLGEQGEEIRRLKDLVLTPPVAGFDASGTTAAVPQWTPAAPEGGEFISRAEAEQIATTRAREETQRVLQMTQAQAYWRDEFFRRNPDLKGAEDIVQAKTAEVGQRYASLPVEWVGQRMPLILDEIAQRTRERLATIKESARAEAQQHREQVAEGQTAGSPAPASPPAPKKEPTLEEQRLEALREEYEAKAKLRMPR